VSWREKLTAAGLAIVIVVCAYLFVVTLFLGVN